MTDGNRCGVELATLLDYASGDLETAAGERLEDHLFECARCTGELEVLDELRGLVASAVGEARVGANVNRRFLERATREGLTLREYRIAEGQTVSCFAGPEDLVVVRLGAEWQDDAEEVDLEVEFRDLEVQRTTPLERRALTIDRELGELVLVFPGETVRSYPRSLWTMNLREATPGGVRRRGPFVLDHTPAERDL